MFKSAVVLAAALASASAFVPAPRLSQPLPKLGSTVSRTAVYQEKDFGAQMEKLEKECEERMDAKVAELMANIDKEIPDVKKGTPEEAEAVENYIAQK
eukprot:scaffold10780_cov78-Cyclotella_meneghiniana.AAC.12